jgi:signal peptidase I
MQAMKTLIREYLPFVLAILCLFAARSSLADHYVVPTGSMEPALMPGDRVVVDKQAYGLRVPFTLSVVKPGPGPARGEVVVFGSPAAGTRRIKRVVARGGYKWLLAFFRNLATVGI